MVWSDDPATYIANALAPATVRRVDLDEATRTATVTADPDQLSLAIGRGGDNARLVARLCGWRIDVVAGEAAVSAEPPQRTCVGCRRVRGKPELVQARPRKRRTGYS